MVRRAEAFGEPSKPVTLTLNRWLNPTRSKSGLKVFFSLAPSGPPAAPFGPFYDDSIRTAMVYRMAAQTRSYEKDGQEQSLLLYVALLSWGVAYALLRCR